MSNFKKILKCYFVVLFICILSLKLTCSIGSLYKDDIKNNILTSCIDLNSITLDNYSYMYRSSFKDNTNILIDTIADTMSLSLLYSNILDNSLDNIFDCNVYLNDKEEIFKGFKISTSLLQNQVRNDKLGNSSYFRYWHGYLTLLIPEYIFFHYSELVYINLLIIVLLLMFLFIKIYQRHKDILVFFSLFFGLCITNFWFITLSFEYTWVFMLCLAMCIAGLYVKNKDLLCFFFVGGMLTAYFDFLTCETVVFTLPLFTINILPCSGSRCLSCLSLFHMHHQLFFCQYFHSCSLIQILHHKNYNTYLL